MPKKILILDEVSQSSIYQPVSYSKFIDDSDDVQLLLITNKASERDKLDCLQVVEIEHPTTNGLLELEAFRLNEMHGIDMIYTKQEDLILRASYLRKELNIHPEGLQPEDAIIFRDKALMKNHLKNRGLTVPQFARVYSPANILSFTQKHGFPVIVKPTLGSASAGIRILKDEVDCQNYLANEFYDRIDDQGKIMDYSGDLIVEAFVVSHLLNELVCRAGQCFMSMDT
jgi:phosphoribosylamine-glycine ligase